jgi:hypothetical protein
MWTKEDESSSGQLWAAEFQHFIDRSHLVRVLKIMKRLFFNFPIFGELW